MSTQGRLTLPAEVGAERETIELIARLGADAVRNSDGTELPEQAASMVDKVYATYFVARGDQDWALAHPDERQQFYLLSDRHTATETQLVIDPITGYFTDQVKPDLDHAPHTYWEVRNRTTGEVVPASQWTVGEDALVTITGTTAFHEYTVAFLAWNTWDSTQMYNYITNDWHNTDRVKSLAYDARHEATWAHMKASLNAWLPAHPEVDVVRFTTFFYHFTLVFNDQAKEKFVDWFGYSASASAAALEAFAQEYGYRLSPEDFVDGGFYNSPFRIPTDRYRDWMAFQHRFVTSRAKQLVAQVHGAGKEAMMFLGDNWIGIEPYGPEFPSIEMDAVVGSVGSAATTRMIADIPGVKYTEGRLLPYFFPDVFRPGGDPVGEAQTCWIGARQAILRNPLDRIGYGGYLSLAIKFPEFIDFTEQVVNEFRSIHDVAQGHPAWTTGIKVAVLNHWGKLRTWQNFMVAHALPYKQIVTYLGVLEALAAMPVEVEFISFEDVKNGKLADVDVVINAGQVGTAFSGGDVWLDPELTTTIRQWVHAGGAFIGVGDPSAVLHEGRFFALSDILGVDKELGFSLSTNKYVSPADSHFITADMTSAFDPGEGARDVYPVSSDTQVLAYAEETHIAVNEYGAGRGVYLAGLPHSSQNARVLLRSILWAADAAGSAQNEGAPATWWSSNPDTDLAVWADAFLVVNSTLTPVTTTVTGPNGITETVELAPVGSAWFTRS